MRVPGVDRGERGIGRGLRELRGHRSVEFSLRSMPSEKT